VKSSEEREYLSSLGQRVRNKRLRRRMTMKQLAGLSGASFTAVWRLENGRGCHIWTYMRVRKILETDNPIAIEKTDAIVVDQ
jgi:hypothetical protein